MVTLIVGMGGTGSKVQVDISRKVHAVYCFLCIDCGESMANDRHNIVQRKNEIVAFILNEKMHKGYAYLLRRRISRIWEKSVRNEYRSVVKGIRESLYQLNQKQDILKKAWRDSIGMFYRDVESSKNLPCDVDQHIRNIELFLNILNQKNTEQSNCGIIQYRLKNGWIEIENSNNSERCPIQLVQLQNQSLGMHDRKFLHWSGIMLHDNSKCRKTDTVKVCECDRLRSRILLNHMSRLFVFLPKLRTIDRNRQISIILAA